MPRDRYAVYRTPSGMWWVIDTDRDAAIFNSPVEGIVRQMCVDKNLQTGGRAAAPQIFCSICRDKGYLVDPDGRAAPQRCSCEIGQAPLTHRVA